MAKEVGTNDLLETWGSTGTVVMPSLGKIAGGWQFEEQPPHEYMNWVHNHLGQAVNYMMRSGVPEWNVGTEYLTNDLVSFGGRLWVATANGQGSTPDDANSNWSAIPSASELGDAEDRVTDVEGRVTDVEDRVTDVEGRVTDVEGRVDALPGRNALVNGNFDHWQRGASFTGNQYGADRWVNGRNGTASTQSRQGFALGQTDVPNEPEYFARTVVSSVAGAGNFSILVQRIEDVRTFAGKTITVSFFAKADAAKNIAVEFEQVFGTGGTPSAGVTGIGAATISLTTTFQKFTVTVAIPSIAGKTLGTSNNDSFNLLFWFDSGSDFNARNNSLGHRSGTFDIAQVQLEAGSIATPFEHRPVGTELALCQRYYQTGLMFLQGTIGGAGRERMGVGSSLLTQMGRVPTVALTLVNSSGGLTNLNPQGVTNRSVGFNFEAQAGAGVFAFVSYVADAEL